MSGPSGGAAMRVGSAADPTVDCSIRQALACFEARRLDDAAQICAAILAARPDDFEAHHLAGAVKIAQGDAAAAIPLLTAAVRLRPRSPEATLNLALALQGAGDAAAALAQCDRALALRPTFPEALNIRGNALRALGRLQEALASYDEALAQRLDYVDALNNRAAALLDLGRADEALASCNRAIAWQGGCADAHFNRGVALCALGRHQAAMASFDEALRYQPCHGAALANKSAILMLFDRHEEALAVAQEAIAHDAGQLDALVNCGAAAQHLGRLADALAAYADVLKIAPDHVSALNNRGAALLELGRPAEALASFERALAVEPNHAFALGSAGFAALNLCEWNKAERFAGMIRRGVVDDGMVVSPFVLLNVSASPQLQQIGARSFARTVMANPLPPRPQPTGRRDKIRIAYLSADFREHPIARLIVELIERHDRTRFEVNAVCFSPNDGSDLRTRLVKAFDHFHVVRSDTDAGAARRIRDLDVDIAIDLTGYTQNCRPAILCARPAPIQVNYLGYPGTMGADFIDYIIADPVTLPLDEQELVTEKIVHLPHCYQANDTTRTMAPQMLSREQAGLPANGFVFCCFNNSFKIQRSMFEVWMRLLGSVENSVLWLLHANDPASETLRREAAARGIDPARLVFAGRAPPAHHLARHRVADLFLDTLPYNAHTTASDALWAGLPIVTCKGSAFAGRVCASLLTAIGLPELIAPDLAAYEALALRLATAPEFIADVRRRLDTQRTSAALFDIDRFRRHIEAAYARMDELRRDGVAPRSFAVPAS